MRLQEAVGGPGAGKAHDHAQLRVSAIQLIDVRTQPGFGIARDEECGIQHDGAGLIACGERQDEHLDGMAAQGLEGTRPFTVTAGALGAWASEHDASVAPAIDMVRRHNDVVAAAMTQQVTPVPLRFGQSFESESKASAGVAQDAARWQSLLERFAERAEYGVRVLATGQTTERDVHTAGVESGREYMAALARKQARAADRRGNADRIRAGIEARVAGLAAEERVEHHANGELLVSMAHLVAWRDARAYHEALDSVRDAWPDTRILFTGPWPPYSFVE